MKKHVLLALYVIVVAVLFLLCYSAIAEEPKKALPELDLVKLKYAVASQKLAREQAQRAVDAANATIAHADEEIDRICKKYGLHRDRLAEEVNEETGVINVKPPTKSEEPTKPKPETPGEKSAKPTKK